MAISKEQVLAVLPKILTPEIREVLQRGVESGLELYNKLDENNRNALEEFASNVETRDLYSSICIQLKRTISEANCGIKVEVNHKTSSTYIEISSTNLIMHLRNETSCMPMYMKEKLPCNDNFSLGKKNYIQLVYKAKNGTMIEQVSLFVMDQNGKAVYSETINGSWDKAALSA